MKKIHTLLMAALAVMLLSGHLQAAPMTNDDVIKMAKAGLDESIIISSIQNTNGNFDTSANGLINLTNAGVSKPIINAILQHQHPATVATPPTTAQTGATQDPDEVIITSNGSRQALNYTTGNTRTAMRGLGFGGVGTYLYLPGPKAAMRSSRNPTFTIMAPEHQTVDMTYVDLVSFDARKGGNRELLVGVTLTLKAVGTTNQTGVPKEHFFPVNIVKSPDQSRAPAHYFSYDVTPASSLKPGEYALAFNKKYFDFGVDQ